MMVRQKHSGSHLGPKLIRAVILIVTLAFAAFFIIVAMDLFRSSRSREIDNQRNQLAQAAGRINSLQSTISNIASLIVYNDVVQKGITGNHENIGEELFASRRISDTLKEYLHIIDGTEEITILTVDGQTLTSRYVRGEMDPEETDWYKDFMETGRSSGYTGVHSSVPMQSGYTTPVISYITGYYSLRDYKTKLGDLIINVEFQTLLDMIRIDATMLNGYALYDSSHEIIASEGKIACSYDEIMGGEENGVYRSGKGELFVVSKEMNDGWVLISEISTAELVKSSMDSVFPIFAIFTAMLVLLGLILNGMIHKVTGPVNKLSAAAASVGQGDFSVNVDIHTGDEIEELSTAFNRMVVDINELMNASVEHEKKIQQMQTENLMLQINPHFIYNTMNSIVYMARMNGNDQIADFTNAFISLLQSTLRVKSSVYTTLGEDLKNVRSYLFLQEYRYGNKFTYETICPQELLSCRIVSVMLQPVVENSIFHGIAPKDGPGSIIISAEKTEQGKVKITVSDDGIGMSPETVEQIFDESNIQSGGVHKIGLGNVRSRIREIYGEEGSIKVESAPGEGAKVTIEIPYEPQQ